MDALPPQTPATPMVIRQHANQSQFRYRDANGDFVLQVQGKIKVRGERDLDFGDGGSVSMESLVAGEKTSVHWDAGACKVGGARSGGCSEEDRRALVTALRQQPRTPTPPKP